MDEYINDLDYEVDKMFSDLYGDMTYNEPPEIENDVEEVDEESFFSSLSSPTSDTKEISEEKGFDELILDKVSETENKASERPSEQASEQGKDEKEEMKVPEDYLDEMDYSDTLSDTELKGVSYNTEDPVIEDEEPAEIPEDMETEEVDSEKVEEETIPPAMEYSVSEDEQGYDDDIIIEEAYDEPEIDENKSLIIEFVNRFSKVFAFAAMILFLIGIPIIFSLLANKGHSNDSSKTSADNEIITEPSTESWVSIDKELTNRNGFDEVQEAAYNSMTETNMSSRFESLEDLTFYLNSNMASILAYEKALATQYSNGSISSDYYYSELSVYLDYTNTLNHLLTINKNTYKSEGKEDEYDTLVNDMDALILYGDTLYYGSDNSSKTE